MHQLYIVILGSFFGLVCSDVVHIDADLHGHGHGHHIGYSSGTGLRSIAQGSADRAHIAVASQHAAAQQAAFIAKSSLAQEAVQAAATATAALAGKEVLLHGLEEQLTEAQRALNAEIQHFELAKAVALSAKQSAETSSKHILALNAVLNNANSVAEHARSAAEHAEGELASQTAMVGQAQERLSSTAARFQEAQIDFQATKEATGKATAAAAEAQENAQNAGQFTTHSLHTVAAHSAPGVTLTAAHEGHVLVPSPHPTIFHHFKRKH